MLFLAIETSSVRGSLALCRDRSVVREVEFSEGLTYVRDIGELVRRTLTSEGLGIADLGGIAVSVGPGSYTGVRVGVTAAKTLAYALRIPVVRVESLRVLAAQAFAAPAPELAGCGADVRLVAPLVDGRQRFLYAALFAAASAEAGPQGPGGQACRQLLPQSVAPAEEVCRRLARRIDTEGPSPALVVGDGSDAFLEVAESLELISRFRRAPRSFDAPRARDVALLSAEDIDRARWDPEAVHRLEPLYLRPTEAERRLAEASRR